MPSETVSESAAVIEARGITKEYPYQGDSVHALRGGDLAVAGGELGAMGGRWGGGKSSLVSVRAGIDAGTAGRVSLLGTDLYALGEGARWALRLGRLGFIFQRFHLLAVLTAAENVELP